MSADWPEWLAQAESAVYEDDDPRDPLGPRYETGREAAEGFFMGVVLTAVLLLAIGCAIFGARVVLGGG